VPLALAAWWTAGDPRWLFDITDTDQLTREQTASRVATWGTRDGKRHSSSTPPRLGRLMLKSHGDPAAALAPVPTASAFLAGGDEDRKRVEKVAAGSGLVERRLPRADLLTLDELSLMGEARPVA
jgi:hypothetical protein